MQTRVAADNAEYMLQAWKRGRVPHWPWEHAHLHMQAVMLCNVPGAPALSKHSMAEPMAVSSWNTGSLFESLGLTVFLFLIRGRSRAPPAEAMAAESCSRFTHKLLELKNLLLHGVLVGRGIAAYWRTCARVWVQVGGASRADKCRPRSRRVGLQ